MNSILFFLLTAVGIRSIVLYNYIDIRILSEIFGKEREIMQNRERYYYDNMLYFVPMCGMGIKSGEVYDACAIFFF